VKSLAVFLTGLLLVGCLKDSSEAESTFYPYSFLNELKDQRLISLKEDLDRLQPPSFPGELAFDSGWKFQLGDPAEGLEVDVKIISGIEINLPHREEYPNHPFWYFKRIHFLDSGFLYVKADDGSQLYINGNRVKQVYPNIFPVDSGDWDLTIRVLNNAMRGGLQQVEFSTYDGYQDYRLKYKNYQIRYDLIKKVLLKRDVDNQLIEHAKRLISSDQVDKEVEVLWRAFEELPYLIGPFVVKDENGNWHIQIITDSNLPVTLRWGDLPDALTNDLSGSGKLVDFAFDKIKAGQLVHYRIFSGNTFSPLYSLDTRLHDRFSFNVWADSQSGWAAFSKTMSIIDGGNDNFGIGIGDLVSNGSDSTHWMKFLEILSRSADKRPYCLIPGNHDYDGYYEDLRPVNYYRFTGNNRNYQSWTYDNAAFIALDPNENFPIGIHQETEQYRWFISELESEAWKKATWRFVLMHQPPFSQGWEGYHGDSIIRDLLEPILESAKVDFVLSGHTHDYERLSRQYGTQKVTFFVLGGAGGGLEPVESSDYPHMDTVIKSHHFGRFTIEASKLLFKAIDLYGNTMDSYSQVK